MPGRALVPESRFANTPYSRPDFARRRAVLRETLDAFESDDERYRRLAQEENMFRRTDCHFSVPDEALVGDRYRPEVTALLSAESGRVYLDAEHPRTCIRGAEDRARGDLGYRWLDDDEIFPFYELRASAQDLRDGAPFDEAEARRRIEAQLDTVRQARLRHMVLSAFGCGAFANPPEVVAQLYRDALEARIEDFDRVVFAVFHPGYGPDNFSVFRRVLGSRAW